MEEQTDKEKGLYGKYKIEHADGHPMDPLGRYFVLRYDKDDFWGMVCRQALWFISRQIAGELPHLARDLRSSIAEVGAPWNVYRSGSELFAAMDAEDLQDVYLELYNQELHGEDIYEDYELVDPDEKISIYIPKDEFFEYECRLPLKNQIAPYKNFVKVTAPAREWSRANGRGIIGVIDSDTGFFEIWKEDEE
jgi:hypothetical protein